MGQHPQADLGAGTAGSSLVEPFDRFNQALVANVHPSDWVNPEPRGRYHLVVLGGGTAGLVTAAIAAGLGARVALVERHLLGGDCLNVGCVPSKAMIAAARQWHAAGEASAAFGGPRVTGPGDFGQAMARMRRIRSELSRMDGAPRFRDLGVDVYLGEGRFTGRDTLAVDGRTLRFRRAVIGTGTRPWVPPIPGLDRAGYLTNETIFGLTELPAMPGRVGAGPAGSELAQTFARFGSQVTLVEQESHILPSEDADAAGIVERAMTSHGVRVLSQARVLRAERRDDTRILHIEQSEQAEELAADQILVATGRAPNVEGIGLEAAGVSFSQAGVTVDDRLRTSNPRIFAVGDICSRHRFTHAADAQARLVVGNALFFGIGGGRVSRLVVPWVIYTSPEVAHVGMHQRAATGRVQTVTIPLREVDRAVLDGQEDGFFRVHLREGTDRILGATLVAEHAGELIGEVALAMTAGVGLATIGATIHPYPTQSEVFRKAADAWRRTKLTARARRVLGLFFRAMG
jgi:Pyruvate/2-oxoglutarate dehydrogenase complex, dihydrolipoamide dehydrogenase (E3) component, and related enzymes